MQRPQIESDFVVSVGPNCRTTWNLKNYTEDFKARPFDWWICPFFSMLNMLEPGFKFEMNADDLAIVEAGEKNTIYNRRLNIYHQHDFDRSKDGSVAAGWQNNIDQVQQKFQALFDSFWQDFEKAEHPVFVLGGVFSFRYAPNITKIAEAGMQVPAFDKGTITPCAAADLLFKRFADKNLSVVVIYPSDTEETVIDPPFYHVTGVDNGHRPPFLPPNGFHHPINVFEEGFARIGLHAKSSDAAQLVQGSNNDPTRIARVNSLIGKATKYLEEGSEPSRERGKKYLVAAYQLDSPRWIQRTIEGIAATNDINLLADEP